jgi:hypothetical protein
VRGGCGSGGWTDMQGTSPGARRDAIVSASDGGEEGKVERSERSERSEETGRSSVDGGESFKKDLPGCQKNRATARLNNALAGTGEARDLVWRSPACARSKPQTPNLDPKPCLPTTLHIYPTFWDGFRSTPSGCGGQNFGTGPQTVIPCFGRASSNCHPVF